MGVTPHAGGVNYPSNCVDYKGSWVVDDCFYCENNLDHPTSEDHTRLVNESYYYSLSRWFLYDAIKWAKRAQAVKEYNGLFIAANKEAREYFKAYRWYSNDWRVLEG